MTAVSVANLVVRVRDGGQQRTIIDDLSFSARDNSIVALAGPSGSGKTTLLSCIAGIQTFQRGSIRLGSHVREANTVATPHELKRIGLVFQDYHLMRDLNVIDNVALPLRLDGVSWSQARRSASAVVDKLDMSSKQRQFPGELSGGERQRVAFARGIVRDPEVLLADEPSAHLDDRLTEVMIDLLELARGAGITVIVSTHDPRVLSACPTVVQVGAT